MLLYIITGDLHFKVIYYNTITVYETEQRT